MLLLVHWLLYLWLHIGIVHVTIRLLLSLIVARVSSLLLLLVIHVGVRGAALWGEPGGNAAGRAVVLVTISGRRIICSRASSSIVLLLLPLLLLKHNLLLLAIQRLEQGLVTVEQRAPEAGGGCDRIADARILRESGNIFGIQLDMIRGCRGQGKANL